MTVDINRPHVAPQSAVTDSVPEWVKDAVFYQIFPERFANGDPSIDPEGVVPWDTPPSRGNFFGGDLAGIAAHLDHIEALGANAIYLTPIFEADTNHRYDTADYFRIDHRLGDLEAFRRFVVAAHDRGIRVVLDAVFNHCGEGHWAFRHLHAHREDSPYRDWFTYDSLPLTREPEANYATCEGCKYLPKLNHANQQVRDYLIDVGRHWLGEGIDGWRLDMPFLMPHDFWRDFRRAIKSEDEDCYIVAEVWEEATEWLHGDLSDGAMNYPPEVSSWTRRLGRMNRL
ncbi:MAG: glycoside hydrolase family 13 protein [Demequina sp.]|nr:glycoside hydrolase family 13 protein [Demequina sp.]